MFSVYVYPASFSMLAMAVPRLQRETFDIRGVALFTRWMFLLVLSPHS